MMMITGQPADDDTVFLIKLISDMARVYNWDVKRRQAVHSVD